MLGKTGTMLAVSVALATMLGGCAPEIGSERWCEAMSEKPRGDWSANEALDYTRHCLFDSND